MADLEPTVLPPAADPDALYVVDISGYVFRAYHALPPLTSPSGEPTHAVLGVTSMLLKLLAERKPALFAVAMDSRTRSFRHQLFDAYKANRPPAPPDLKQQMERVREIIEAYAIPVYQQDGMEADDLIASLVKRGRQAGLEVVIVSADKDLLQLVGEGVCVFDSARDRVMGPAETVQKLGVRPEQVRDYLALVGDSSDNVPGVKSVGPKTAVQLLAEHGSLEGVYAHLDAISRKALREKLEQHRDDAFLSKELVTLRDDLDVPVDRAALKVGGADLARLRTLFKQLGFTRLLDQLPKDAAQAVVGGEAGGPPGAEAPTMSTAVAVAAAPDASAAHGAARLVSAEPELHALAAELRAAGSFAWLSVLDGPQAHADGLVGVAAAWGQGQCAYVPLGHAYLGCVEQPSAAAFAATLGPVLADASVHKLCADAKRERMVLARHGVTLGGVGFDVGLASYLLDPDRHAHGLLDVARFELDRDLGDAAALLPVRRDKPAGLAGMAVETTLPLVAGLARAVQDAAALLAPKLRASSAGPLLFDMELPLSEVLAEMQLTGIRVDPDHLRRLGRQVSEQLVGLEARCHALAGHNFNVNSPRQLETILFDELALPVIKRTKTSRSTDQGVLEDLALQHELPAAILEYRSLAKLLNTYLEALPREILPRTGRIHTDFRQTIAATGRLSSSDPNLQNIPIRTELGRQIRDAFCAREGWRLLAADYSQIELRVLAHLSHDPELLEAFRTGEDVHRRTARAIFGVDDAGVTREMRAQAKTVNFAVIYGQTQFALARNLRIERGEAGRYIQAFFQKYAGVQRYMDEVVAEGAREGLVRTLCGRVRYLPDLHSRDRARKQAAERVARNTPIQGSAADIIKLAMIAIDRAMKAAKLESRMLLTVHDELVFEAPPDEEKALAKLVVDHMAGAYPLEVPLVVDSGWGTTWGQAH